MFLVGDVNPYTYVDLILPDGGRIHYVRISPGTSYVDAEYEHIATPTAFYKSRVQAQRPGAGPGISASRTAPSTPSATSSPRCNPSAIATTTSSPSPATASGAPSPAVTLKLYDVADVSGTVSVGGPAVAVTITTPGQNASLTFAGTSGQQVTVHVTNNAIGSMEVKLLKPDGTTLTSGISSAGSFDLATQTLPTTGTYTIAIDPWDARTGSLNVAVTSP
jgi:hypothetical protein